MKNDGPDFPSFMKSSCMVVSLVGAMAKESLKQSRKGMSGTLLPQTNTDVGTEQAPPG